MTGHGFVTPPEPPPTEPVGVIATPHNKARAKIARKLTRLLLIDSLIPRRRRHHYHRLRNEVWRVMCT